MYQRSGTVQAVNQPAYHARLISSIVGGICTPPLNTNMGNSGGNYLSQMKNCCPNRRCQDNSVMFAKAIYFQEGLVYWNADTATHCP